MGIAQGNIASDFAGQSRPRTWSLGRRLTLACAAGTGALLVGECGLRLGALVSPSLDALSTVRQIPDPRFGWLPNPGFPEHDANGFRNTAVPAKLDVVCLGDSQTYGMGVRAADAWPQQLADFGGLHAYNAAYGGFGPVHHLLLWDRVVSMRPRVVVEAVYMGNDLYDSYQMVYGRNSCPMLRSEEPQVLDAIAAAEAAEPLTEKVSRVFNLGELDSASSAPAHSTMAEWFKARSRLVCMSDAMLEAWGQRRRFGVARDWSVQQRNAEAYPQYYDVVQLAGMRTVLTPAYRLCGLDRDDVRIREGFRTLMEALRRMEERAATDGIRFVVLLIPTKEIVFGEVADEAMDSDPLRRLKQDEAQFREELVGFLQDSEIPYVDSLNALCETVRRGDQPYGTSPDGHPNAAGHRAIARAVLQRLREDGLAPAGTD